MELRQQPNDLLSFDFTEEEKRVIYSMSVNPTLRAYLQSQRTHYVTNHILRPLDSFQLGDPKSNFALDEAYLKGALDAFNELLSYQNPAPEEQKDG